MQWSREHLLIAMHLYCQIPFGQMHSRNPTIIAVAEKLGRSSGSLAMKLVNLASLDPSHKKRGIKGLANASRADRAIWEEFNSNWEDATEAASSAIHLATREPVDSDSANRIPEIETDRLVQVVARTGQHFFRAAVLSSYGGRCCVTGLSVPELLVASHIVPWKLNKAERLNPKNGLCLSTLLDKAFDRGLISFREDLTLVIGRKLRIVSEHESYVRDNFMIFEGREMVQPERFAPNQEFLRFHREQIFEAA